MYVDSNGYIGQVPLWRRTLKMFWATLNFAWGFVYSFVAKMDDHDESSGGYGSGGLDEDMQVPRTAVVKLLKQLMPPGVTIAKDTNDFVTECGTEFVHLVSSTSMEVCEKAQRGVINGDHVMGALSTLGFGAFVPQLRETCAQFSRLTEEHLKKRRSFSKWGSMTQEELDTMAREQERIFKEARLRSGSLTAVPSAPSPLSASVQLSELESAPAEDSLASPAPAAESPAAVLPAPLAAAALPASLGSHAEPAIRPDEAGDSDDEYDSISAS